MLTKERALSSNLKSYLSGKKYKVYVFKCCACTKKITIRSCDVKKHKGLCSSCGKRKLRPFEHLYNILVRGAEKKSIPVELTYEEFLTFVICEVCYYCNSFVEWNEQRSREDSYRGYNLDRKDNSKGYLKDNLVVCCKQCNRLKSNKFSSDEFKAVQLMLRVFRKSQKDADELMYTLVSWEDQFIPIEEYEMKEAILEVFN